MSIKKLLIKQASYIFEDDKQRIELDMNYLLGEYIIRGDKNSKLYKEVEKKANDLILRKSNKNLA